jgi:hypothetical protein
MENFKVRNVTGDSDCFFHVLAVILKDETNTVMSYVYNYQGKFFSYVLHEYMKN